MLISYSNRSTGLYRYLRISDAVHDTLLALQPGDRFRLMGEDWIADWTADDGRVGIRPDWRALGAHRRSGLELDLMVDQRDAASHARRVA